MREISLLFMIILRGKLRTRGCTILMCAYWRMDARVGEMRIFGDSGADLYAVLLA